MPTIQQLVRKGRKVLVEKSKSPALNVLLLRKNRIQQCVKLLV